MPKHSNFRLKQIYFGEEALEKIGLLDYIYPMKNGVVSNWEHISKIYHHIFDEKLKISPQEYPIIISDHQLSNYYERKNVIDLLFLTFEVASLCLVNKAILSLHATGRDTGLVVHSEEGVTHIVPIFEGKILTKSVESLNLGREHIRKYLSILLSENGNHLRTSSELKILDEILNKYCYVPLDYEKEKQSSVEGPKINLPNGKIFTSKTEHFSATEAFFKPELIGESFSGIHEIIYNSIQSTKLESLFQNIVLSGENTLYHGLELRLRNEISVLNPFTNIVIIAHPQRNILPWIGGSKYKTLKSYRDLVITREDYERELIDDLEARVRSIELNKYP